MRTFTFIIAIFTIFTQLTTAQDCGQVTSSCITATLVNIDYRTADTEITINISLDDFCLTNNAVSHVSFGMPQGMSALTPGDGNIYTSDLTAKEYNVENMTNNPFYCIKFNTEDHFEGIKKGQEEDFVFTIPAGIDLEVIPVEVKIGPIATFMDITIHDDCRLVNAMPVELMSFKGRKDNGNIALEWSTATEENSSHFEIQKSTNGLDWEAIGNIESNHNSVVTNHYAFIDRAVVSINNYYRLRMVDLDETFEYSDVIMVNMGELTTDFEVRAFPNPTTDYLQVTLNSKEQTNVNISIVDVNGRVIQTTSDSLKGTSTQRLDVSEYNAGVYFLVIDDGIQKQTQQFIKK